MIRWLVMALPNVRTIRDQCLRSLLFVLALSCSLASSLRGQVMPICDKPLDVGGQWAGPWDLRQQINRGPAPPRFSEIVHAVLLPPPNDGWVLLWCARYCGNIEPDPGPASRPYETFLWRPSDPGSVVRVAVPQSQPFGSDDLFCGGQLITPEGLVVVFGGTDIQANCYNDAAFEKGHQKVWIFDNRVKIDLNTNPWTLPPWIVNASAEDMLRSRWYATCCVVHDGRIFVGAHAGPDPLGVSPHSSRIREYGRISLSSPPQLIWDDPPQLASFWRNRRYSGIGFSVCATPDLEGQSDMAVYSYEHIRQLTDGRLIGLVARKGTSLPYPLHQTFFLDFNACPGDANDHERWVAGPGEPALMPNPEGAPSAHLIDDAASVATEVIYSLGGGSGETQCPTTSTDAVVKMALPTAPGTETWVAAPVMGWPRNSCNAVIALDGSIIAIGGIKPLSSSCQPVTVPERLRPPEIFKTGDMTVWKDLCPQAHQRAYHSCALTLADGRIVSVGGTDPECPGTCDPPPPSWDSIEIYSPPFLFAQDRPQILNSVQPSGLIADLDPSEPLTLEVVLPGTIEANSEFRVALLRPSAVTHANDMSQRYIRLRVIAVVKNDPPASSLIDILGPSSRMVAPAGHYMITVVSSDGVPSVAKWVRISPP